MEYGPFFAGMSCPHCIKAGRGESIVRKNEVWTLQCPHPLCLSIFMNPKAWETGKGEHAVHS